MTEQEDYNSALKEVKEIFTFLTEGQPTPDDEIEAKDMLITQFNKLRDSSNYPEEVKFIEGILHQLNDWDTLDLWFSETTLPSEIMKILNITPEPEIPQEEEVSDEQINGDTEIDLTDIFNKVSEQFKGEIDTLKGTIDSLKKELEKKEESLSHPTRKREVHKITPHPNAKLPPPVIKIPAIKKLAKPPREKLESIPTMPTQIVDEEQEAMKEQLIPTPTETEEMPLPIEESELTPITKKSPSIETIVIEESEDRPLTTGKMKITSVVPEKPKEVTTPETSESKPFLIEIPKISAVKIEEIESESIVSSGSDLFNVFSSVGTKPQEKPQERPQEIIGLTEKSSIAEEKKKEDKKKKKEKDTKDSATMPFINFNESSQPSEPELETPNLTNLPNDKDALYQELIALEGRRYSLERNFKDVEKNYNKGSISEADFKRQNNILKKQLVEITSRINNIRGIISSL
ncbi:MAG: hypothetical protein EAX91_05190 [Candidatus Lokiarchaeota archaeon]|nr:hypothetical protein [Candidatus Lokiarchaeota archaeon]